MRRSILILAVVLTVVLAGCSGLGIESTETDSDVDSVDDELEIHHIDVGQADSTLLITPDGEKS